MFSSVILGTQSLDRLRSEPLRRTVTSNQGKDNLKSTDALTQKMRLKVNIMYFKQQRQPLTMLHFLNSKRNTKDKSR